MYLIGKNKAPLCFFLTTVSNLSFLNRGIVFQMHCYVPLLAEKLRYDLKMEENKGKTKDDTWKQDRTDKSYLGWLIMMGQMMDMFEVMVLYGLKPEPCITTETKRFASQFMHLYKDAMKRQDANKELPDADTVEIFHNLQATLKFSQRDGSKSDDKGLFEKSKVKFQVIKSIEANLKVDQSMKKL